MMSYLEEVCQGAIIVIVVCLLILSAVMRRRKKQKRYAETRETPQEPDERFSRMVKIINNSIELHLHDYNNAALQKRAEHDNCSNLVIRVQF